MPFIVPMYGVSDVLQAFTRLAAVQKNSEGKHMAVQALGQTVAKVEPIADGEDKKKNRNYRVEVARGEGEEPDIVECGTVIYSPEFDYLFTSPTMTTEIARDLRTVLVVECGPNKPPPLGRTGFGIAKYLKTDAESEPVTVVQLDSTTGNAPEGTEPLYCVLHFVQRKHDADSLT